MYRECQAPAYFSSSSYHPICRLFMHKQNGFWQSFAYSHRYMQCLVTQCASPFVRLSVLYLVPDNVTQLCPGQRDSVMSRTTLSQRKPRDSDPVQKGPDSVKKDPVSVKKKIRIRSTLFFLFPNSLTVEWPELLCWSRL